MASKINNLARLDYNSGTESLSTDSNVASINMIGPVDVKKYALETAYRLGESITYHIFITNGTDTALTNVTVEDDLGTYALNETTNITPLTYVKPSKVFIDSELHAVIEGVVSAEKDSIRFGITTLDPGKTMFLSYKVMVNEYAPEVVGTSHIVNTVSVTADGIALPVTATNTLPLARYTDIVVQKTMTPETVADGDAIMYTFDISNYGTEPATAAKLTDIFNPIPTINDVYLGTTKLGPDDYSMNIDTGEFTYPSATTSTYRIDAATFAQDPSTGIVTPTPATSKLIVYATI